jgi:purine-binding chemotaxis protein CheW
MPKGGRVSTGNGEARPTGPEANLQGLAGKYLTFVLAECEYGVSVRKVREIVKLAPITAVPQVASWVKGVINLRGKVIPVIDLRLKFNLPAVEYMERTCIIVVEVAMRESTVLMGIIVDSVSDVMSIATDELEEAPRFGNGASSPYIDGLAKIKSAVKILLNLDHVCGADSEIGAWLPSVA